MYLLRLREHLCLQRYIFTLNSKCKNSPPVTVHVIRSRSVYSNGYISLTYIGKISQSLANRIKACRGSRPEHSYLKKSCNPDFNKDKAPRCFLQRSLLRKPHSQHSSDHLYTAIQVITINAVSSSEERCELHLLYLKLTLEN